MRKLARWAAPVATAWTTSASAQALEPPPPPPPSTRVATVHVEPLISGSDILVELGFVVPTLASTSFTTSTGATFNGSDAALGYDLWPDWCLRLGVAFFRHLRIGVRTGFGVRDTPSPGGPSSAPPFDQIGPAYQAHVELFPEFVFTLRDRRFVLGIAAPIGYREIGLVLHADQPTVKAVSRQLLLQPQASFDLHFGQGFVIGWYAGLDLGVDPSSGTGVGAMFGFRFGGRGGLPPRGE